MFLSYERTKRFSGIPRKILSSKKEPKKVFDNSPNPLLPCKRGLQPLLNPRQSLARTKKENHGRPCFSLCFGIAGRRDEFLYTPTTYYAPAEKKQKAVVPAYQKVRKIAVSAILSLHPLHIGRGLVKVDAFFSSFFRAERKDKVGV